MKLLLLHGGTGWKEVKESALFAIESCAEEAFKLNDPLEMVVKAVKCMEDSGEFNAGLGSTYDLLGRRSLDAGVACCGRVGAVANVKATKNAILLARQVMDLPPHMVAGEEADELARLLGLPPLPPIDGEKRKQYEEKVKKLLGFVPERLSLEVVEKLKGKEEGSGTVGAVALAEGKLAAATSTGGIALKFPGRVGDSPIFGAGFYADDLLACSSTGIGAKIVKVMPCLRLRNKIEKKSLAEAGREVLEEALKEVGPSLGFIAVTRDGEAFWGTNYRKMIVSLKAL